MKEIRDEQRAIRKDVGAGVRTVPSVIKRYPTPAIEDTGGDRGSDREVTGRESREDAEARRRAEETALNSGVGGVVSSFSPPGHETEVPPHHMQEKNLYEIGDSVTCQNCEEPVYEVREKITTQTKIANLKSSLLPYSDKVPALTAGTKIRTVGGVAFDCPLCGKEDGVPLI